MLPNHSCQMSKNLGLGNIFQEIQLFLAYLPAMHVIIIPLKIFIFLSHGSNDFDDNVKEALYIKKQKPL